MIMSGFAGHIDSWLAVARQKKISNNVDLTGQNFPNRQRCVRVDGAANEPWPIDHAL